MNSILVYFKIFNPLTALMTTTIAELGFAIGQYIYAKKKLNLSIPILTKQNITYLVLCILFIPISYAIRLFKLNFWINFGLIVITCAAFYLGILLLKHDDNLFLAASKVFGKIKKVIRRKANG
jgi:hypothetical protein